MMTVAGPGGSMVPMPRNPPESNMTALPGFPGEGVWLDTGTGVFRYAARVGTRWWVLRLNDFPEHPMFTLFIDAQPIGDLDDLPPTWRIGRDNALTRMTAPERARVLRLMAGLAPYGSETGRRCTGDWCSCDILTDEYAARAHPPPTD